MIFIQNNWEHLKEHKGNLQVLRSYNKLKVKVAQLWSTGFVTTWTSGIQILQPEFWVGLFLSSSGSSQCEGLTVLSALVIPWLMSCKQQLIAGVGACPFSRDLPILWESNRGLSLVWFLPIWANKAQQRPATNCWYMEWEVLWSNPLLIFWSGN